MKLTSIPSVLWQESPDVALVLRAVQSASVILDVGSNDSSFNMWLIF